MQRLSACALWIGCLSSPLAAQTLAQAPFQAPTRAGLRASTYLPFSESGAVRAVADMDLDGDMDLIRFHLSSSLIAANGWNGFEVWSNQGRGRFEPQTPVIFAQPANINALLRPVVGDVNGDGFPDLVLSTIRRAGPGVSGFEVHYGTGDGNFQGAELLTAGGDPYHIVLGNIDADPALEIGVDHSGRDQGSRRHVRWWNHSSEGFVGSEDLDLPSLFDIHAMDVDLDGFDDLVIGLSDQPTMLWFLPTVDGSPTPGPMVAMSNRFLLPTTQLHSGDLDADGDLDLFLSGRVNAANSTVLQSVVQTSPGIFSARSLQEFPPPYPSFAGWYDGQLADWDGDGDDDFIANEEWAVLWENDGQGVFSYAGDLYGGIEEVGAGVADMNGDGILDVIGPSSIYYNKGGNLHQRDPDFTYANARGILDWEGDGDLDFLHPRGVFKNDGAGHFTKLMLPVTGEPAGFVYKRVLAEDDFDGDGDIDSIASYFENATGISHNPLLVNNGADSLQYGQEATPVGNLRFTTEGWPTGDLDGDGDIDIVELNGHWVNDGTGQFTGPVLSHGSMPLLVTDVDGDGDTDIVGVVDDVVTLFENDGTAVFAPVALVTDTGTPGVTSLDLDDDGDRDLVVASPTLDELRIYENRNESLTFSEVLHVEALFTSDVGAFDVTGDGRSDLIVSRRIFRPYFSPINIVSALRRKPWQLEYHGRLDWATFFPPQGFFDVDGDGDTDGVTVWTTTENDRFIESEGRHLQYGSGSVGSGGFEPVLGLSGPARLGETCCHRVRRGLGGAAAMLIIGLDRIAMPSTMPGLTLLVDNLVKSFPLSLSGTPGVPGEGQADFCFPVTLSLLGVNFYHQVLIIDGGGSATNGTLIHFGREL